MRNPRNGEEIWIASLKALIKKYSLNKKILFSKKEKKNIIEKKNNY